MKLLGHTLYRNLSYIAHILDRNLSGKFVSWSGYVSACLHSNTAPQFGHRRCLIARQQRTPRGKKKIAQKTPRHVKSSCKTPIWKVKKLDLMTGAASCSGMTRAWHCHHSTIRDYTTSFISNIEQIIFVMMPLPLPEELETKSVQLQKRSTFYYINYKDLLSFNASV